MKTHSVRLGIIMIALVGISVTGRAQPARERVIERLPVEKNEPIEIIDTSINGQSTTLGQKFTANDEWIKTLVFTVKNKSDKRILFASIQLQFPPSSGSLNNMSVYDIFYGSWALQTRSPTALERLAVVEPGQSVEMRLSTQQFIDLREFLMGTNFPKSIERVDVRIDRAIFEDDSMWSRGTVLRRDPNDSTKWTRNDLSKTKSSP